MNYNDVLAVLSDLPSTFTRPGNTFQSILAAFTAGSARNTIAIDALLSQLILTPPPYNLPLPQQLVVQFDPTYPTASWGWLDATGKMYGIARNPYETDPAYRNRIAKTLIAPHVTPTAMIDFIQLVLGISISITENFNTASYSVSVNQPVSDAVLINIVDTLVWVRPAGVPFLPIFVLSGGLFLNTLNYFGTKKVTGSYLVSGVRETSVTISDTTPAPQGLLPTVYLTDPFLTGVISPQNPFVPVSSDATNLATLT